ncbi:growth/differentiation factor 8 isoform X3 [Cherax quadricarinatus]|uniref:growth/differentiation factor 8 isoform X3 n=1 Tax=Cherax quadricarinatus TaxID=27406 RepID=UPI00387EAFD6
MQWSRYLLIALVLLQALTEAKRRRNNNRTRHDRRHNVDRPRNVDELQMPQEETEGPHHQGDQQQGVHHYHHQQQHQTHRNTHQPLSAQEEHEPLPSEQQQYCPSCYQFEMRRDLRLEQIKDRVLTATGLLTPPNMTGIVISKNPNIQGIIEEVESAHIPDSPYNDDEPEIKTEKMFSPVEPAPPELRIPEEMDVLYFKLNHEQLGNRVMRAILHVWLKPMHSELDRSVPVTVYKVLRPNEQGENVKINMFDVLQEVTTVSESFDPREGNWVKIGVYKLLQEWLNKPDENLGLVVTAFDSQGRQVAVTDPKEMPSNAPLLEIHTEETRRSRSRRNSGVNSFCTTNNKETRCCRYPMVVNFVDLGWDFIVAPKVYEANFCNGECPFLYAHKYAHTTLMQKLNSTSAKHGPCCGARKLSPMKMLYYDHDHKIKFDTIQDMVVDRCGCS